MISTTTAYVLVIIFIATFIRSTLGFGEALVAVPLLVLRIPVAVATPFVVAVSVIVAGANLVGDWRHVEMRSARGLILTSLLGLPLGVLMLRSVDDRLVKLPLGAIIIGLAVYHLTRRSARPTRADSSIPLVVAGVVSGVLGGAYGMNGPPLAIYGTLRGWSPLQFRATLQGYFLVASVAGLVGYAIAGLWSAEVSHYLLISLPSVFVAIIAARAVNRWTDGARFYRFLHVALLAIGAILIGQVVMR